MPIFIEILTRCGSSILFIVRQRKYYTSHLLFRTLKLSAEVLHDFSLFGHEKYYGQNIVYFLGFT